MITLPRVFLLLFFICLNNLMANDLKVIESSEQLLKIKYTPKVVSFKEVLIEEILIEESQLTNQTVNLPENRTISTYIPKIKNAYNIEKSQGNYSVIARKEYITVPGSESFLIKYIKTGKFTETDHQMAPVPYYSENGLVYNYNSDNQKSTEPEFFSYKYVGKSGERHLIELSFVAAYYNSETKKTKLASSYEVEIKFNPNYSSNQSLSDYDPNISINHNQTKSFRVSSITPKKVNKTKSTFLGNDYNSQNWIKLKIDSEGIYRISSGNLSNLNYSINKNDIETIRLFGNGGQILPENVDENQFNSLNEQDIIVNKNSDGSLKEIIFYASAARGFKNENGDIVRYNNPYTKSSSYLLTWGGENGKRANAKEFNSEITNKPQTYTHNYFFEEEVNSPFSFGASRQYIGNIVNNITYSTKLEDLYRDGAVRYYFSLAHKSNYTSYFDIRENGNVIKSDISIAKITTYTPTKRKFKEISINANQISSDGVSKIGIDYINNNSVSAYGYLDYFEIHYDRYFRAIEDELSFFTNGELNGGTEFTISGFSPNTKYVFDITEDNDPKLVKNYSTKSDEISIRENLIFGEKRKYFASSKLKTPTMSKVKYNDLRSTDLSADMILYTHKDLLESANRYKAYRESKGEISVLVVTMEDVYMNFASGMTDPLAIRDFNAYATVNWDKPPKYVLLWGDGHSDYKKLEYKAINYVPPFEYDDDDVTYDEDSNFASDDFFTYVLNDDQRTDIAIGRVTVDSPETAERFLDKLIDYEENSSTDSWRTRITLVADDAWAKASNPRFETRDGTSHVSASEYLANTIISKDMQITKLYLPEYKTIITNEGRRKPDLNLEMAENAKNEGAVILNWIGHGNPAVWAHEVVFSREKSVKEFTNYDKLFFVTAATCDFSRFDQATGRTGADELLLSQRGGAIGVFGATRIVYAGENEIINDLFYKNIFTRDENNNYLTVGEAFNNVKQTQFSENDKKYFILGDPSMRLNIPNYTVKIDSFNGEVVDSASAFDVKGLSIIRIKGHIEANNTAIANDFNGEIKFVFNDGTEDVQTEADGVTFYFKENGGVLNINNAEVVNGEFQVEFQLPRDISYSENNGKLFAFAQNGKGLYAKGIINSFKVNGIDGNAEKDDIKPTINIYLDSERFEKGDAVSSNPLLIVKVEDNIGVNSAGYGIGRKIEAFINDGEVVVDLTNTYAIDKANNKAGFLRKQLNELPVGRHTVKIRAWDLQNNYSIDSTYFYVSSTNFVNIINATPNPFEDGTVVQFEHNINPPFEVDLQVVDNLGKSINNIQTLINTAGLGLIQWNGLDKSGNQVPSGSYMFLIKIIDKYGNISYHKGSTLVKIDD